MSWPSEVADQDGGVRVVAIRPEHHEDVIAMLHEHFRHYTGEDEGVWRRTLEAHTGHLHNPGWVALAEDRLIGFISTYPGKGRHHWATVRGLRELLAELRRPVIRKAPQWERIEEGTDFSYWFLDSMWGAAIAVDPEYRRLGIANRLVAARDAWARNNGVRAIFTTCVLGSGMPELYERLGYVAISEMKHGYYPNGAGTRLMVLPLREAAKRKPIEPMQAFTFVNWTLVVVIGFVAGWHFATR